MRSSSRQEDDRRSETSADRITKTHGGQIVQAIAPEELESFNDSECKHEKLVRDESETEFNAFVCANPNCNEVVLFNKD